MAGFSKALDGQLDHLVEEKDIKGGSGAGGRARARDAAAAREAAAVAAELATSGDALSARARNQAKRLAKQAARATASAVVPLAMGGATAAAPPPAKRFKREQPSADGGAEGRGVIFPPAGGGAVKVEKSVEDASPADATPPDDEDEGAWESAAQWPFEPLCAELR